MTQQKTAMDDFRAAEKADPEGVADAMAKIGELAKSASALTIDLSAAVAGRNGDTLAAAQRAIENHMNDLQTAVAVVMPLPPAVITIRELSAALTKAVSERDTEATAAAIAAINEHEKAAAKAAAESQQEKGGRPALVRA